MGSHAIAAEWSVGSYPSKRLCFGHSGRKSRQSARLKSACVSLFLAASTFLGGLTVKNASAQTTFKPSTVFLQAGEGEDTRAVTVGLTWDWDKSWSLGLGRLGGHWELSASRWSYPPMDGRREAWLGQVGVVPTLRYRWDEGMSTLFVEAGIGASWTTTLYQTQRKRFSTTFNFADHVGIGWTFGASREHEISLRIKHYSNAGIKRPNPGVNLLEIRYSHSL